MKFAKSFAQAPNRSIAKCRRSWGDDENKYVIRNALLTHQLGAEWCVYVCVCVGGRGNKRNKKERMEERRSSE